MISSAPSTAAVGMTGTKSSAPTFRTSSRLGSFQWIAGFVSRAGCTSTSASNPSHALIHHQKRVARCGKWSRTRTPRSTGHLFRNVVHAVWLTAFLGKRSTTLSASSWLTRCCSRACWRARARGYATRSGVQTTQRSACVACVIIVIILECTTSIN